MDMYFLLSTVHSVFFFVLSAGLAAPTGETPSASTAKSSAHVRTKRCSCATFLDKECVYFCHLDIIWVNTPERVVSYGLGNAPRTKRSSPDSTETSPRCRCLREDDQTCSNFCQREKHYGYKTRKPRSIHSVTSDDCYGSKCKHKPAANNIQSIPNQALSPELRAVVQTRTLLEKWRMRRRHRNRSWDGHSTAT